MVKWEDKMGKRLKSGRMKTLEHIKRESREKVKGFFFFFGQNALFEVKK